MKKTGREVGWIVLFIGPSLAGFSIFYLIPFLMSFFSSLIESPFSRKFVGLSNYIELIGNPMFRRALRNTLLFTGLAVPLCVILSLFLALLMNKAVFKRKVFRTLLITPLVCPTASIVIVWQILFKRDGLVNSLFSFFNLQTQLIDWLNSGYAVLVVILLFLWKNLGYNMIIFLAGLNSIPREYYEVAQSFGAGSLFIFLRITLVYLAPTTFFVIILSIINSFKIFREVFLLTGYYPDKHLYMIQHYINNCFTKLDMQKLSSASTIFSIFIFIVVYLLFRRNQQRLSNG